MFMTRVESKVSGRTSKECRKSYAPDGRCIVNFTLAVGNGTVQFPTMWVKVCLWQELAENVFSVLDRKGINVEVCGYLVVSMYEGVHGKSISMELKEVKELKVFDREGKELQVIKGE